MRKKSSIDIPSARVLINAHMSEKELQSQIIEYAMFCGWILYHTYDSRRSQPGFPDLVLVRPCQMGGNRLIFAEIKTQHGRMSKKQWEWFALLDSVGSGVEVYIWRPSDWKSIEERLT